MATKRPFTAPPGIKIPSTGTFILDNTTASTGTTVGALVISGGVGIGGSLYVNSATSISGIIINAGVITGSLTGSATTSNYSHQSGYAITSSSSGTANTSTYANQSGYAITSGSSSTSGLATTSTYSHQSGYAITTGSSSTANTATYANQSGYAITSGSSNTSGLATTATYSHQSGYGLTSGTATTAANVNVVFASTSTSHPLLFTPTSGSASGVALSSNSTLVYNPSTDRLSVSGLAVTSVTTSTSTSTGALIVSGGVGVGGTIFSSGLNIQDNFTLGSQIFYPQNTRGFSVNENYNPVGSGASHTAYHFASGVGRSSIYFDLAISNQYTVMFGTYGSAAGNTFVIGSETANSDFEFRSTLGIQPVRLDLGTLLMRISRSGNVSIPASTTSTSTSTGALSVSGGVGIGGSLYVASATAISGITINAGVITGSLTGTATTSTYSLQAGYAITSGSSSFASTASYSYQSGYGLTSGLATTANYAHQSGYAITSGSSNTSGYATTSGLATTSTNINVVSASTSASHPVLFTPATGTASGAAVSSETSFVYNPSTDILSVSGLAITSGTASTSSSSGALTVSGGAGVAQSVSIGGRLQLFNSSNYTAFVSSASGNTVYTLPATSPATGSSVLQSTSAGVLSWVPMTAGSSSGNTSQNIAINTTGNANALHPVLVTPSSLSAGSAVSSDTTFLFNPSTEILYVSGMAVTSRTVSTSTSSGALVVNGGLGVSGQLTFATASFGFTGITSNPTMSFIGATSSSPITLTVLTDNSLSWEGSSGQVFAIDSNLSTGEIFAVSDISGIPIISASAGQTVTINEFGGFTKIGNGTLNSSSTSTGSLVIAGGFGITGNAFIGGTTTVSNTTASTSSASGALVVSGGVGIGQTLFIGGNLYQNTNAITAFDTGFRNRVINGDGNIDQRNNGSTTTPGVGAINFIDRWKMNVFGSGRLTIGQNYGGVTAPDGFVSYIGMKTTTTSTPAANDYNFLTQMIEGSNTIDLQWGTANAKPITISFWAYSSLTGTFGASLRNSSATRSYPYTYTISASNTWEKKTVVIPGDTTGTWSTSHLGGFEIIFVIANGTTWQATPFAWVGANATGPSGSLVNLIGTLNATLYLTGIQVEIGSVSTPYERRNYGHEFALCQRYYQITEVRTGGYHTTGGEFRGSGYLGAAMRPITSPVLTVLATDESANLGTLNVNDSNFRGDSFRYIVAVTTTGTAYGQWKVSCDTEF